MYISSFYDEANLLINTKPKSLIAYVGQVFFFNVHTIISELININFPGLHLSLFMYTTMLTVTMSTCFDVKGSHQINS